MGHALRVQVENTNPMMALPLLRVLHRSHVLQVHIDLVMILQLMPLVTIAMPDFFKMMIHTRKLHVRNVPRVHIRTKTEHPVVTYVQKAPTVALDPHYVQLVQMGIKLNLP